MQIIDVSRKGNVARFLLGENGTQWGDDWNDAPYEHNAGGVYGEYVRGHHDMAFPYDWNLFEPCDGESNSHWSKEDMIHRRVPCLIAVPPGIDLGWDYSFRTALSAEGVTRFYFGDELESDEPQEGE
jgi:hypothetical protein